MITDSKGNKWYKGNLHTHTTSSDGAVSPGEAIKLYNGLGYDFVALTDHWHVNEPSARIVRSEDQAPAPLQ